MVIAPQIDWPERKSFSSGEQFSVRLQRFSRGGFEGTCYWRDLDEHRHNPLGLVGSAKRERDREQLRAQHVRRASTRVRHLCREIGADTLVTFTTREQVNERGELMKRFSKFVRRYRVACEGRAWLYVAVAEPHPTNPGHWHVHVACRGGVMINTARTIWWELCGGRAQGNVHAKRFESRAGDLGSTQLARYVSKYVSKGFGEDEPEGQRRFRAAVITLDERAVLVLAADAPELALRRLLETLRLARCEVAVFWYRDGSGFFFSHSGESVVEEPPPF